MIKLPSIKALKESLCRAEMTIHFNAFPLSYMRTECCDAPVGLIEDFWRNGHWVLCSTCKDFKAYVPDSMQHRLDKVLQDFTSAVRTVGMQMQQLFTNLQHVQTEVYWNVMLSGGDNKVHPWNLKGMQEDPQSKD